MTNDSTYDIIIIGGSYAGLSAAMALGRALRSVLIIDSGKPCNRQTPHSHNFLTQDGSTPKEISGLALEQVLAYPTVGLLEGLAISAERNENGFRVVMESGETVHGRKVLFATGVADRFPEIEGFADCWGISVLHCPYCHGYEVSRRPLALVANGDMGFEMAKLISHWAEELTLLTNGASTLTEEQAGKLSAHAIKIVEQPINTFEHTEGRLEKLVFADGSSREYEAVFAKIGFTQHCHIPEALGCQLTEQGYLWIDDFQRTSVPGIYAAGDNTSMLRSVAHAVAAGNKAGAVINRDLVDEDF